MKHFFWLGNVRLQGFCKGRKNSQAGLLSSSNYNSQLINEAEA